MRLTLEEKDRLFEILFYTYFDTLPNEHSGTDKFWITIKSICDLYNIHGISITKAVRILSAAENRPKDDETYYLLNKMGLTVRPIVKVSGIYWQKQKEFASKEPPKIRRRCVDPVIKKSIREFIKALYDMLGVLHSIDKDLIEECL